MLWWGEAKTNRTFARINPRNTRTSPLSNRSNELHHMLILDKTEPTAAITWLTLWIGTTRIPFSTHTHWLVQETGDYFSEVYYGLVYTTGKVKVQIRGHTVIVSFSISSKKKKIYSWLQKQNLHLIPHQSLNCGLMPSLSKFTTL